VSVLKFNSLFKGYLFYSEHFIAVTNACSIEIIWTQSHPSIEVTLKIILHETIFGSINIIENIRHPTHSPYLIYHLRHGFT
jgi:hypothetical protein